MFSLTPVKRKGVKLSKEQDVALRALKYQQSQLNSDFNNLTSSEFADEWLDLAVRAKRLIARGGGDGYNHFTAYVR